jgi:hypothetical protein
MMVYHKQLKSPISVEPRQGKKEVFIFHLDVGESQRLVIFGANKRGLVQSANA